VRRRLIPKGDPGPGPKRSEERGWPGAKAGGSIRKNGCRITKASAKSRMAEKAPRRIEGRLAETTTSSPQRSKPERPFPLREQDS